MPRTWQLSLNSADKVRGDHNDFYIRVADFLPRDLKEVTCQLKSVAIPNKQNLDFGDNWYAGQGFNESNNARISGRQIYLEVDFQPLGGHNTEWRGNPKYTAKVLNRSYGRPFAYMGGVIEVSPHFPKIKIQRPQGEVNIKLYSIDEFNPSKALLTLYGGTALTNVNLIFELTDDLQNAPHYLYLRSQEGDLTNDSHGDFKIEIPNFLPPAEFYQIRLKGIFVHREGVTVNGINLYDGDDNQGNSNAYLSHLLDRVEFSFQSRLGYSTQTGTLKYLAYVGASEGIFEVNSGACDTGNYPWMTLPKGFIGKTRVEVKAYGLDLDAGTEEIETYRGVDTSLDWVEFVLEVLPLKD